MANTQNNGGSNTAIVAIFVIALIVIALVIIFVVHPFGGTTVVTPGSSAAPSASVKTSASP